MNKNNNYNIGNTDNKIKDINSGDIYFCNS